MDQQSGHVVGLPEPVDIVSGGDGAMALNQTRAALMALLRGPRGAQQMELFKQQTRRMGGRPWECWA